MSKKDEKKEITERLSLYIELDSIFRGSLEEVSKNILNLENRLKLEHAEVRNNPDKYFRFDLKLDQTFEDVELEIFGVRLETDEEFQKRLEKSKKMAKSMKEFRKKLKDKKEKQELNTYLKLKKKFESK